MGMAVVRSPLCLQQTLHGAEQGRTKDQEVVDLLHRYGGTERLKRTLHDPNLAAFYADLADKDIALAEEGTADYHKILEASGREQVVRVAMGL